MRAVLVAAVAAFVLGVLLSFASALIVRPCASLELPSAQRTAVVLGESVSWNGILSPGSAARTRAAEGLFASGLVTRIHFTGSSGFPNVIPTAEAMAARALENGVPATALTVERRSLSTLENALLSRGALSDAQSIILVTTGFHAWRARASFAWAGIPPDRLCRSGRFDTDSFAHGVRTLALEGVKWPLNTLRALVWSGAARAGLAERLPEWWLA